MPIMRSLGRRRIRLSGKAVRSRILWRMSKSASAQSRVVLGTRKRQRKRSGQHERQAGTSRRCSAPRLANHRGSQFSRVFSGTFESSRAKIARTDRGGGRMKRAHVVGESAAAAAGLTEREGAEGRNEHILCSLQRRGSANHNPRQSDLISRSASPPQRQSGGAFSITETVNTPGKGPPRHRRPEAEISRVLEGRYLYEMDSRPLLCGGWRCGQYSPAATSIGS